MPRQTGAEKWREFRRRFRRRNRNLKNQRMILLHSALSDDKRTVVNSVEAELTNMVLKSISARSLPDPHTLQMSSHLLGSKVLQVNHTSLYFSLIYLVFCLVAEKIDEEKAMWAHRSVVPGTKMNKKYSFEKLQVGAAKSRFPQQDKLLLP
nr:uncharacterized protein LOC108170164 isoform X2 [Malus domestica]